MRHDLAKGISEFEKSRDLFKAAGDIAEAAIAETWAAEFLPNVGKIAESRERFAALIADAESRKFNVLLPTVYYWLGVSDFLQKRFSDSARHLKTALRLAEAGNNSFETLHAAEALALNYSELGELEPALSYSSKMLSTQPSYFENPRQRLRDLGTLADITLRLEFMATTLSLSKESLSLAQARSADGSAGDSSSVELNAALRHLIEAAEAQGDFNAALDYANESKRVALKREDSGERTRTVAEINMVLAQVKIKMNDCAQAVVDYDQALELFARLPEFTFNLYQIHKGKLFCFQELGQQEDFARELSVVLQLSEDYRATIREDSSRQAFFANEQEVFDAANAL